MEKGPCRNKWPTGLGNVLTLLTIGWDEFGADVAQSTHRDMQRYEAKGDD